MTTTQDFSFDITDPHRLFGYDESDVDGPLTVDGAAIFEPTPVLRYTIDYPLPEGRAQNYEHVHTDGSPWSRDQFAERLFLDYAAIYVQADDFGVWGHDIEDLVFEGAERRPDGSWRLEVGS